MDKKASKKVSSFFSWAMPGKKYAVPFNDGWAEEKELLGTKGANLCEMFRLGLPVPHGFVLNTEACHDFYHEGSRELSEALIAEIERAVKSLEGQTGKLFGNVQRSKDNPNVALPPLMLSIRASPIMHMGGLSETVLDLGLNSLLVNMLTREFTNHRWIYDVYLRCLAAYGTVVQQIDPSRYDDIVNSCCEEYSVENINYLPDEALKELTQKFRTFTELPDDPMQQLHQVIKAFYLSWNSPSAIQYRRLRSMSNNEQLGIIIQTMVHGDFNDKSGAGIAYTRNPNTGIKELYGEFLMKAVGDDVLRGNRNPLKLEQLYNINPPLYDRLINVMNVLEQHYRDVQIIEFTMEDGYLYVLETKHARRSAFAAVKIANDMVMEKLITEREALLQLNAAQLTHFLYPTLDPHYVDTYAERLLDTIVCRGKGLGFGVITGPVVFSTEDAIEELNKGRAPILTYSDDGDTQTFQSLIKFVRGVILTKGANARSLQTVCAIEGKTAVIGAQDIIVDSRGQELRSKDGKMVLHRGDLVTIDGSTGIVYEGELPTITPIHDEEFQTVLHWADKYKRLQVLANADTAEDVKKAMELGAEGVGLCRTEHMFFAPDRIDVFRQLILTENESQRKHCLEQILKMQQKDFLEIFRAAENHEVVIRLFDSSLNDLFPSESSEEFSSMLDSLSRTCGLPNEVMQSKIKSMSDIDSQKGLRGARLWIVNPVIFEVQLRALFGAVISEINEHSHPNPKVTILIPFVFSERELQLCTDFVDRVWGELWKVQEFRIEGDPYSLGLTLDLPRAFLIADKLVANRRISMVSMSGSELTELVFGMDRGDAESFMDKYLDKNLFVEDPFRSIDGAGVSNLIRFAKRKCKVAKDSVRLMLSADNGYDARSMEFLEREGFNGISCLPAQVPKDKVLAAQAHIRRLAEFEAEIRFTPPMVP